MIHLGPYRNDEVVFVSDTHYGHQSIIRFCERPFSNVQKMDAVMWRAMQEADAEGKAIVHLGDVMFRVTNTGRFHLQGKERHICVIGNHDKQSLIDTVYPKMFATIVGKRSTWKTHTAIIEIDGITCLLSHEPQIDLQGGEYNLHGHHHSNMHQHRNPFLEYDYIWDNKQYINLSVELTNYRPISFQEALLLPPPQRKT